MDSVYPQYSRRAWGISGKQRDRILPCLVNGLGSGLSMKAKGNQDFSQVP